MRAPCHRYTWEQYLAADQASSHKHEFFAGEIYAVSGGTPAHAGLAVNLAAALHPQLEGKPCRAYSSDLRIRVEETGLGTHPDLSVVCGELRYDPASPRTTVTNPVVLVDVLSDSTEEYDRGAKFENYQRIPTFREYVLVSHREQLVEVFRRGEDHVWSRSEARTGGRIRLESISAELQVDSIYAGIDLG